MKALLCDSRKLLRRLPCQFNEYGGGHFVLTRTPRGLYRRPQSLFRLPPLALQHGLNHQPDGFSMRAYRRLIGSISCAVERDGNSQLRLEADESFERPVSLDFKAFGE